jgi:hypothetical protein
VEAGWRRSPTRALACHWSNRNGRLECRWQAETNDAPTAAFDQNDTTGRGCGLALAG